MTKISAQCDRGVPPGLAEVSLSARALFHPVQKDGTSCGLEAEHSILTPQLSVSCHDVYLGLSK